MGISHTFVIAEVGSCHDGSFHNAKDLIWAAKYAGADAVKFQYWSSPARLAARRHMDDASAYERYQVPNAWLFLCEKLCDEMGIEVMCTAYRPGDIAEGAQYVQRFKVSSFESQDLDFLLAHVPYKKPSIMSLGMGGRDVLRWRDALDVSYLHCVSGYPTPTAQLNLRRVGVLGGLSDHSTSIVTGGLAVAAGATIIEKHIRLERTPPQNPDCGHALPPLLFRDYVQHIRFVERVMGDGLADIQPCEAGNVQYRVIP